MAHEKGARELSNCPLPLFLIAPHSGGHPRIVWISHCPVVLRVGQGGLDLIEKKAASRWHADSLEKGCPHGRGMLAEMAGDRTHEVPCTSGRCASGATGTDKDRRSMQSRAIKR